MKPDRFFYVAAGAIFLVLIVLGFQKYIFHGQHVDGSPIAPVMLAIVVAHSTRHLSVVRDVPCAGAADLRRTIGGCT